MPFKSFWEEEIYGPASIDGPRDWGLTPENRRLDCWQGQRRENVPYPGFQDKAPGGYCYSETKAEVQFTQRFIKV